LPRSSVEPPRGEKERGDLGQDQGKRGVGRKKTVWVVKKGFRNDSIEKGHRGGDGTRIKKERHPYPSSGPEWEGGTPHESEPSSGFGSTRSSTIENPHAVSPGTITWGKTSINEK